MTFLSKVGVSLEFRGFGRARRSAARFTERVIASSRSSVQTVRSPASSFSMWTESQVGCLLTLIFSLGLGGGAMSFAEETAEHCLIGAWQEQDSGDVVKIGGVQPDGTALGTMGTSLDVQHKAEIKVDGSRVRIATGVGNVIEVTRTEPVNKNETAGS